MNLKGFVEVAPNIDPIVRNGITGKIIEVDRLLQAKTIKNKIVGPSQIARTMIDGEEATTYHLYVGTMDQVVFAFYFRQIDGNFVTLIRRFEKANVVGKALWGAATNAFAGKPRTLGMEVNLVKNIGKAVHGTFSPSPLNSESRDWADFYFGSIMKCFTEVVAELGI